MKPVIPLLALFAAACGIPGPESPESEIGRIGRPAVTAPDGVEISYLRAGAAAGARVIHVHGTPGDAVAWAGCLIDATDKRKHIAVDRPGLGRRGPAGAVVPLKAQACGPWVKYDPYAPCSRAC